MNKNDIRRFIRGRLIHNRFLNNHVMPYLVYRPGKRQVIHTSYEIDNPFSEPGEGRYCIISDEGEYTGLFERWMRVAAKAMYAVSMGYIPFIDFQSSDVSVPGGNTNFWDAFFKQYDEEITREEVYSQDPVRPTVNAFRFGLWLTNDLRENRQKINGFKEIYKKIGVREDVFREELNTEFPGKTLGIMIRRQMEWGNRIHFPLFEEWIGHHTRGHIDQYALWIDQNLDRLGFDYFFLATEDRETMNYLKKRFGNKCLCYDRHLLHLFINEKPLGKDDPGLHEEIDAVCGGKSGARAMVLHREYIAETLMLSKCDALLKNDVGQQAMALIMSENEMPLLNNTLYLDMYEK